jgi:hypothetical protein
MTDINQLVEEYIQWLKDKTILRSLKGWTEITTPHLDRHNDYIQIYVKSEDDGGVVLTDDAYTIDDLETSGCSIDSSPKRKKMVEVTLNGFGVERTGNTLFVRATADNFPVRKHSLIQAILAVNDLFVLSKPSIESFFLEDVNVWLDSNDIRYVPDATFKGRSGFEHKFDFVIPRSKKGPERFINTINNPRKDTAQSAAFSWVDTKDFRMDGSEAFFVLNDDDKQVPDDIHQALTNYGITPVLWSHRDEFVEHLAA